MILAASAAPSVASAQAGASPGSGASGGSTEPGQGSSDPQQQQLARTLFMRGDAAYREGRYQAAIELFQEAYRLSGRALLLFNIANAQERLGQVRDAIASLEQYLPNAGADSPTVEARLRSLRQRLETEERERAQREAAARQNGNGSTTTTTTTTGVVETPGTQAPRGRGLLVPGVTVGIVGVASLITSGVFGAMALSSSSTARMGCAMVDTQLLCSATVAPQVAEASRNALVSDITLGVGLALAATGIILIVMDVTARPAATSGAPSDRVRRRDVQSPIVFAPRPDGADLGVRWTF